MIVQKGQCVVSTRTTKVRNLQLAINRFKNYSYTSSKQVALKLGLTILNILNFSPPRSR